MTSPRRWLGGLTILAVGGFWAASILSRTEHSNPGTVARDGPAGHPVPVRDAPPRVPAEADGGIGGRTSASGQEHDSAATSPTAAKERPPWLLRAGLGPLSGSGGEGSADARLSTREGNRTHWIRRTVGVDGTGWLEIDFTELGEGIPQDSGEPIEIRVEVGDTIVGTGSFFLFDVRTVERDGALHRVVEVDLDRRELGVVRGTVLAPGGEPLAGCAVGLHRRGDGRAPPEPLARTETDSAGSFRLRVDVDGELILGAVATSWRPHTVRVPVRLGATSDLGAIELRRGAALTGRVVAPPGGAAFHVHARQTGSVDTAGALAAWWGGAFEHGRLRVETSENGEFAVWGLVPDISYGVALHGAGNHCSMGAAPGRQLGPFTAPAQGLSFSFQATTYEISVGHGGTPLEHAIVSLFADGQFATGCRTDDTGRTTMVVHPDREFTMEASLPGFDTLRRELVSPSLGEIEWMEFELVKATELGSLRVDLEAGDGPPVLGARIALTRADLPEAGDGPHLRFWWQASDGPCLLEAIPQGSYEARILVDDGTRMVLPVNLEVRVVEGAEAKIELVAVRGGRLDLQVIDRAGELSSAPCSILSLPSLDPAEVLFSYRDVARGTIRFDPLRPHPLGGRAQVHTEVVDALPAGAYRIEVRPEGEAKVATDFEIVAGRTRRLRIPLP